MPDVIVVGAGPVGTLLAAELARRNVDVEMLERRERPGGGTRAIGVHAPVLAALEASGATERLLDSAVRVAQGEARSDGRTLGIVRFDRLHRRFPFVAALPQAATEHALAVGAPEPRRGATVTAVTPQADGIHVSLSQGEELKRSDRRGRGRLACPRARLPSERHARAPVRGPISDGGCRDSPRRIDSLS